MLIDVLSLFLGMFMGIGCAALLVVWLINSSNNKGDSKAAYNDFSNYELITLNFEDRGRMPYALNMYKQSSALNPDYDFEAHKPKPEYDENGNRKIRYR